MPLDKTKDTTWLLELLVPAIDGTRQRRKSIEAEFLLNYRAWQGWPSYNYTIPLLDGAIHYFVPHARRAVERNVTRIKKLCMPQTDWFQALPFDLESHAQTEAVQSLMLFTYQHKISANRIISTLARNLQLYNFAVLNTSVKIENNEVWPTQKAVDPFNFYVFPDTASSRDDAILIFEDTIIPYQVYDSYVTEDSEKSLYLPLDIKDLHEPEWPYHLVERLSYRGLTSPSDFVQGTGSIKSVSEADLQKAFKTTQNNLAKQAKAFVSLTKAYFRIGSEWYYAVLCNNTKTKSIVRVDSDEFMPCYQWSNTRPLAGELYTNSPMDDIRVLQNLTNTAMSQVESNRSRFAEPPLGVDQNSMGRMENKTWANRQVWATDGDPSKIFKDITVNDTSTNGIRAFQIYSSLIDKNSGGTMSEGQPGRNMPRAGGAMQNLLNLSLADTDDSATCLSEELLTPGLSDIFNVFQKYVPVKQLFKIPSKDNKLPQLIKASQLQGSYNFIWQNALSFEDSNQKADKLMQFMTILMQPNVLQVLLQQLQQQGQTLDFVSLFKTVYTYGLGERGLGELVIAIPPEVLAQQKAQQQAEQQMQAQQLELQQQSQQSEQANNQADIALRQGDQELSRQQASLQQQQSEQDNQFRTAETLSNVQSQQVDNKAKEVQMLTSLLSSMKPNGASNGQ